MGIRLDWQVESDQTIKQKAKEDPAERRRRWLNFLRLLVSVMVLLALLFGTVYFVSERLGEVTEEIESVLAGTVQAEVAALRIGDETAFMSLQRSATEDWLRAQEQSFAAYQQLLSNTDTRLTGRITSIEVDGPRGRVQVEEIQDGVPYVRTWFYWDYQPEFETDASGQRRLVRDGGWRHVPPDYTFWGEERLLEDERLLVRYRAVDELVAQQVQTRLTAWLNDACSFLLACADLPRITVDILATALERPLWHSDNPWQLLLPSPYTDLARADRPFDTDLEIQVAELLAQRLVERTMTIPRVEYGYDSYYLRSAVISWLVGRFVELETNSFLITSLVRHYGEVAVPRLLDALRPTSDMDVLGVVVETGDLSQTNLDWRDLLTWRLVTENDLINRGERNLMQRLYDPRAANLAQNRYDGLQTLTSPVVLLAQQRLADDGVPQLRTTVQTGSEGIYRQDIVLFNLVNNVWRRAS